MGASVAVVAGSNLPRPSATFGVWSGFVAGIGDNLKGILIGGAGAEGGTGGPLEAGTRGNAGSPVPFGKGSSGACSTETCFSGATGFRENGMCDFSRVASSACGLIGSAGSGVSREGVIGDSTGGAERLLRPRSGGVARPNWEGVNFSVAVASGSAAAIASAVAGSTPIRTRGNSVTWTGSILEPKRSDSSTVTCRNGV